MRHFPRNMSDIESMLETFLLQATNHSVFTHIRRVKNKILFQTLPPAFSLCHHLSHISSFFFSRRSPRWQTPTSKEWSRESGALWTRRTATGVASLGKIKHLAFVTSHPLYKWPHPQATNGGKKPLSRHFSSNQTKAKHFSRCLGQQSVWWWDERKKKQKHCCIKEKCFKHGDPDLSLTEAHPCSTLRR